MKKKFTLLLLAAIILSAKTYSQDFLGLSTGNYSGITGVMMQPASIVDSRFKFDINLFSTGVNYSNNYLLVNRNAILKFKKNNFDDFSTFKDNYLSEGSLDAGEKVFFNINSRVQLPVSFMATTGKKSAIAFNMQLRTLIQGRGISSDLAHLAYNDFYDPALINRPVNASGININSLSWAEAGLTYGRVLYSSDKHFLKAAFTGKYLAGVSSIHIASNDLTIQVNGDSTFNFNSANVSYHHNKNADLNKLFNRNFNPDASAFGFDAGLVYEYRGNLDHFKYIRNDDEVSYLKNRRDVNKYIFKLGVSLLDAGMFRFNKPDDVNSFSANINNWDLRNAHYNSLRNFDTALAARVIANPNEPDHYNVYLPAALSAQFDIRFVKHLFLNVMSYWPVSMGDTKGQRFNNYGFYTITPRYEGRHFGLYIPYTIPQRNEITNYKQNLLGATLRIGPLFIGSSNLGTMLFKKNLRAADVHAGLKIGFTYGKPNKTDKFLNTLFNKNQIEVANKDSSENFNEEPVADSAKRNDDKHKLILDYKNGKIYEAPDAKQNIIIINNYYYGNTTAPASKDTMTIQNPQDYSDTSDIQSLITKIQADSISKITVDSLHTKRKQLDSLIRSMQQLQMQMDSSMNGKNFHGDQLQLENEYNPNSTGPVTSTPNESPGKYLDNLHDQQNKLYKRYARQSSELANEMVRLNNKLAKTRQYEKANVNYVPMGIPYNSTAYSRHQAILEPTSTNKTDTIRVQKTDTVYIRDTVTNLKVDTVHVMTVTENKPDAIKIKEALNQAVINYTAMPAEIVLFGIGKWTIQPIYDGRLNFIAGVLKKNPGLQAIVTGHTDSTGSPEINKRLSMQRAESVAAYLKNKEVPEEQISIRSFSSNDPAVAGNNQIARSQNRRVEVQLINK